MSIINIEDFDVTAERGFLTPYDMGEVSLPEECAAIIDAGKHLSDYMCAGRVRCFLDQLPELDMDKMLQHLSDAQQRLLMVHYSFIIQAYVWGEPEVPECLPRNLSVPYCKLSDQIGQFPLLPYSSYTLDNWAKLDPEGDVTVDNIYVIQNFLDGMDENWFIMVHIEIEAVAGKALAAMNDIIEAVNNKNVAAVISGLKRVDDALDGCNLVFDRMPERCDPHTYYLRVRPYIHGWKDNPAMPEGLVYEGVEKFGGKGQVFRGQTGSQSSIVPTMDALLGIYHENDDFRAYLDDLHQYRPPKHRMLIEEVQKQSRLREFVLESKDADLVAAYNKCIEQVGRFRTRHLEYAASYINKQARSAEGNPTDVGTGGTPFMKYLKKHRDESRSHLIALDQTNGKAA